MSKPVRENYKRQPGTGSKTERDFEADARKTPNGRTARNSTTSRGALRPGWRRSRIPGKPTPRSRVRAQRVIDFIEKLRVPKGIGAGKKFKLRKWQREFVIAIYSNCHKNGKRRTRTAILSIARKNGKTALIAALVLVHLIGPESIDNSDLCSAANDKDQAGILFKYVRQIVALSPTLTDKLSVIESTSRIVYHERGNVFEALSAEAGNKHGLNPAVIIYDELAQSKNRDLFDALETSQGGQEEPLFVTISTQSNDPQHPLSLMIDDGLSGNDPTTVCHLYEVPDDVEDVFAEKRWYSANPALGDFRSLAEIRKYAAKALRLPSFENTFRNLYLNQRVSSMTTLFTRSIWTKCAGDVSFKDGERVYLALDFAQTTDLCSLAILGEESMCLDAFFWKPEDLMDEHSRRDRKNYRLMLKQGHMEPCPGKIIDPKFVANKIAEFYGKYEVVALGYDRWKIEQLIKNLNSDEIGIDASQDEDAALRLVPWGQGFKDMSPAVDAFEAAAIDEKLVHSGNPILTWNVANAIVVSDPAGNRKLDKAKSRMRIDGAVAATMVIGLHARFMESDEEDNGSYMDDEEEMVVL